MKESDIETLEELCRTYGAYAITVALAEYARKTCVEFMEVGNHEAVIHKHYSIIRKAVILMS